MSDALVKLLKIWIEKLSKFSKIVKVTTARSNAGGLVTITLQKRESITPYH